MNSKWIIEGIENYRFGEDKKLYKLPFESNGKFYGLREIKKQYPNRYRINDEWWSERQLKPKLKEDPNPVRLTLTKKHPF